MFHERILSLVRRSPAPVRHAYLSLAGLRRRIGEYNAAFRRNVNWMLKSDWWPAERSRDYQDARVRELAAHAYANVPFYRQRFDAIGLRPGDIRTQDDLRHVPVLHRADVPGHERSMLSRRGPVGYLQRAGSSGTTGKALTVWRDDRMRRLQRAVFWRHRGRFGVRWPQWNLTFAPGDDLALSVTRPPFWMHDYFGSVTRMSLAHLTPEHLPAIAAFVSRQSRCRVFGGWSSAMALLANYMLENDIRPAHPPRIICCGGMTLPPSVRDRLAHAFQAPVTDRYGSIEFAGHACDCPAGRYHLDFETCAVETVPVEGAPDNVVKLRFTGWGNPLMPFIRYELGDLATLSSGPCPCGRQSITFDSFDGRLDDYLVTPSGRKIVGAYPWLPSARLLQLVQERADRIEVRVVRGTGYDPSQEAETIARLCRQTHGELEVRIVHVEDVERTPLGKVRAIVSRVTASPSAADSPGAHRP